jgi:uncharacterized protein DUF6982
MIPQQPSGMPGAPGGENNLVVARYRNGQVVKGYTRDFFPERPLFHVLPKGGAQSVPVKAAELKAVFFVRDLLGNRLRHKNRRFPAQDVGPQTGRRIAVLFEDGELLVGHAQTYTADRPGFFVFPIDPNGNNLRVYVLRAAVKQVKLGPEAEKLAVTAPKPKPKFKPPAAA